MHVTFLGRLTPSRIRSFGEPYTLWLHIWSVYATQGEMFLVEQSRPACLPVSWCKRDLTRLNSYSHSAFRQYSSLTYRTQAILITHLLQSGNTHHSLLALRQYTHHSFLALRQYWSLTSCSQVILITDLLQSGNTHHSFLAVRQYSSLTSCSQTILIIHLLHSCNTHHSPPAVRSYSSLTSCTKAILLLLLLLKEVGNARLGESD